MPVRTMERHNDPEANNPRDKWFLMSGAALLIVGAGLILSRPNLRRQLNGAGVGNLLLAALPDFQRLLRLRAM